MSELDCEITFCLRSLGEGCKIKALPNERPDSSISSLLSSPPPPPLFLCLYFWNILSPENYSASLFLSFRCNFSFCYTM